MTTSQLWKETHGALLNKEWDLARRFLDDLGLRNDNHDRLPSAEAYGVPKGTERLIQDRIDLVNSKVV